MSQLAGQSKDGASGDRLIAAGLSVVTLLFIAVSPSALLMFGWQYGDSGGTVLEKFHPATLILAVLFAFVLASRGNPVSVLHDILHAHPILAVFLGGIGFMTWYAARVVQLPFTLFIETFLPAFFLFVLLYDLPERLGTSLARLIHLALFANAVLGISESVFGFRLTPLVINGEVLEDEPRATALMGHPLANAMVMGSYLLTLAVGGGRDLPAYLRPIVFLVCAASMAVFGGRAATALLMAFLALVAGLGLLKIMRGRPFDTRNVLAGLVVVPVVAILSVVLYDRGFFGTFLDRVQDDAGSAETRVVMFDLFRHQNWHDLLFMPDPEVLSTWARLYGTDLGIESFVIQYLLTYGIIATAVFLPALFAFSWDVARHVRPGGGFVIAYFFIVAATSVGLSAKSPAFTMLMLLVLVLMRKGRGDERGSIPQASGPNYARPAAARERIRTAFSALKS